MSFTDRVRDELAHVAVPSGAPRDLEIAGLLRTGGVLVRSGGGGGAGLGVRFRTSSGPVVRRLLAQLRAAGADPQVEVHRPTALQRSVGYQLRLRSADGPVLVRCGLLDEAGRPCDPDGPRPRGPRHEVVAYLRGAVMGGGSLSDPRAAAHAEIAVGDQGAALHLAGLLRGVGVRGARAGLRGERWRVVGKSGEEIGSLLALLGAHTSFLAWDEARLRRELRGAANRVANADRANVGRAVGAASRHVVAIERLVAARGWEGLPEALRSVALARVTNPQASLAELGGLLDPPVAKGTVHRRLAALVALAAAIDPSAGGPGEGGTDGVV